MIKHIILRVGDFDFEANALKRLRVDALESCAQQINKAKGGEEFLKIRDGSKIVGKVIKGTAETIDDVLVAKVKWDAEKYPGLTPDMQRVLAGFRVRR